MTYGFADISKTMQRVECVVECRKNKIQNLVNALNVYIWPKDDDS